MSRLQFGETASEMVIQFSANRFVLNRSNIWLICSDVEIFLALSRATPKSLLTIVALAHRQSENTSTRDVPIRIELLLDIILCPGRYIRPLSVSNLIIPLLPMIEYSLIISAISRIPWHIGPSTTKAFTRIYSLAPTAIQHELNDAAEIVANATWRNERTVCLPPCAVMAAAVFVARRRWGCKSSVPTIINLMIQLISSLPLTTTAPQPPIFGIVSYTLIEDRQTDTELSEE